MAQSRLFSALLPCNCNHGFSRTRCPQQLGSRGPRTVPRSREDPADHLACQGNPASCRRKYVREEALEAQFTELLGRLKFDDEVLEWVRDALHASHADERREHEEAIRRHQTEFKRLQDRINAMYVDKVDGLIETAFFEKMSNQWREEQNRCQREIERHQNADKSYKDEGIALLDLARNAQRLFAAQEPREKRRLLNFLLSNCTWEDGEMVAPSANLLICWRKRQLTQTVSKAA
jgi:hypothetical protein